MRCKACNKRLSDKELKLNADDLCMVCLAYVKVDLDTYGSSSLREKTTKLDFHKKEIDYIIFNRLKDENQ